MKAKRKAASKKSPAKSRKTIKAPSRAKARTGSKAKKRSASRSTGLKRKVKRPGERTNPSVRRMPLSELPDREQRLPSTVNPGASEGGAEGPELWENAKTERANFLQTEQSDWTEEDDEENFPEEYQEWDKRDRRIA